MNWEAFTRFSSLDIQVHWATAVIAFAVGLVQLLASKGTTGHRWRGRLWVALMFATATAAFFIRHGEVTGLDYLSLKGMSWIHLFVLLTFVQLPLGLWGAMTGRIRTHKFHMVGAFLGALVIAGAFTFIPGRRMHLLFFGDAEQVEQWEEWYGR